MRSEGKKMKKYVDPEMNVIWFSAQDVIATSLTVAEKAYAFGGDDVWAWNSPK